MQISISILACLLLLGLETWPSSKEKKLRGHSHALATALVEFHKNQCYFISAIEIAALVLQRQFVVTYRSTAGMSLPFFDFLLSAPLSMNGFVPVTFTLTCISQYGRLSWHVIILTALPITLSSGNLVLIWLLQHQVSASLVVKMKFANALMLRGTICGSKASSPFNTITPDNLKFPLIWVVYIHCIVCGVWCIAKHTIHCNPRNSVLTRLLKACEELPVSIPQTRFYLKVIPALGSLVLAALWALCFAYHIYLYAVFFRNNLVPRLWTFGQIIAVVVWTPSIVEFLYIEYSKPAIVPKFPGPSISPRSRRY